MSRHLDIGLSHLSEQLLGMAGYVEQAIDCATQGWRQRNLLKIQEVYSIEKKVNLAHMAVDDSCFKLLALQQPLAVDLRLILSSIKINSDLERMVEFAVNIANNTEYYLKAPQLVAVPELVPMSDEVRIMVREVLDAFVRGDAQLAQDVLKRDDKVDDFKRRIVNEMLKAMKSDPSLVDSGMNVIFMAKNLERIGDHATNIAEDVILHHLR